MVDHRVERAVCPGEDVPGRNRDQMAEDIVQVDRRSGRQRRELTRHRLGKLDQHRPVRHRRAMVEGRVDQPPVSPPGVALGVQHAAAGGKLEDAADPGQARVIVVIVLHDPADAVRIADDKKALTEQAALDKQLLEQFLVAGGERILLRRAQQAPGRQAPGRTRRHRWKRRRGIEGGHAGCDISVAAARHGTARRWSRKHRLRPARLPDGVAPGYDRRKTFPEGAQHGQEDRHRRGGRGRRLYRGASWQKPART